VINSNLNPILGRLATMYPWQTDGRTTTTTKGRPLLSFQLSGRLKN